MKGYSSAKQAVKKEFRSKIRMHELLKLREATISEQPDEVLFEDKKQRFSDVWTLD